MVLKVHGSTVDTSIRVSMLVTRLVPGPIYVALMTCTSIDVAHSRGMMGSESRVRDQASAVTLENGLVVLTGVENESHRC
jgi:hypothetical protein